MSTLAHTEKVLYTENEGVSMSIEQLARHDERLKNMDAQITKLDEKIDNLSNDIQELKLLVASVRGGWWVFMALGSIGGFLSGMLLKYVPFMR